LEKGIPEEELKDEIKRKERQYGGYITAQGALFLIAKERGIEVRSSNVDYEVFEDYMNEIDLDEFTISINRVQENMTNIVLLGKIAKIFPLHEFTRKDGMPGVVGSFLLADHTDVIKIVLWGEQTELMNTEFFEVGTVLRVINGYAKVGRNDLLEVHLSKKGKLILNPDDMSDTKLEELEHIRLDPNSEESKYTESPRSQPTNIKEVLAQEGFVYAVSGYVTIDELKEFDTDEGELSFLLKFTLSDESGSVAVNVWGMHALEILKILEDGIPVKLIKIFAEHNEYTGEKELHFTKNSILEFL
jgi:replication factor A1